MKEGKRPGKEEAGEEEEFDTFQISLIKHKLVFKKKDVEELICFCQDINLLLNVGIQRRRLTPP